MRLIEFLTETKIRAATKPGYHPDGAGLYLAVTKAGTRSWVLRFRFRGRTREAGLGSLLDVGLVAARKKAAEYRALLADGVDPIEHAKASRGVDHPPREAKGPTFETYAEECIDGWEPDWKNTKLAGLWRATLKAYAYPIIGDLTLDAIETRHIIEILKPIWRTKSETASRVRERIERVLAAAAVEGLRPATNPAAWRGHLSAAKGLGKKRKAVPHRSLHHRALPAFLVELRKRGGVGALALEFLILTVARSGEVRKAHWSEIDIEARTWTVPGERMKAGREHVVPLCDRALEILGEVKPLRNLGGVIFPGTQGQPLSDMTLSQLVRAMRFDCVPHGFRATFKTWAEETTDHANVVIEAALAHAVGDATEQAYMRGDRLAKRIALMNDWGDYCTTAPVETVVPLKIPA
jgi:integrase